MNETTSVTILYQPRHFNRNANCMIPEYYGIYDADSQQLLICQESYNSAMDYIKKEMPDVEII